MSHNLNFNNGKASMFYVGEVPWHQLGTKLPELATAEQAIIAAGLDYKVEKRKLLAQINTVPSLVLDTRDVEGHFATVRMDTTQVLGVVGSRYEVVQNKDAFSFFDALVGKDEAMYETAGALGKGERIWIMAKLPGFIKVKGEDIVNKYLLLYNSHDGSSTIVAKLTPIRVVCNNTLSMALADQTDTVSIRHTRNVQDKLSVAHTLLGLTNNLYEQLESIFQTMSLKQITSDQLIKYIATLFPYNPESKDHSQTDEVRSKVYELQETGLGASLSSGTLWGAYNAITEYADHVVNANNPQKALKSIWFGAANNLKQRAFKLAQSMN